MSSFGDIIPISSRRPPPAATPTVPRPWPRRANVVPIVYFMLAFAGVGGLGVVFESRAQVAVTRIESSDRGAIFARARTDLRETCSLPEASEGPLRDHCRETATFVLLFPECDAACGRAARAVLPQARK